MRNIHEPAQRRAEQGYILGLPILPRASEVSHVNILKLGICGYAPLPVYQRRDTEAPVEAFCVPEVPHITFKAMQPAD